MEGYTAYEILKECKEQFNVEIAFKFLKDPIFVGAIYLKKPERVEALSYVFLLERKVRKAMEKEEKPLIIPGKVEIFKPTGVKYYNPLNS